MACNLLIEYLKNSISSSPLAIWLKNSKYPEAFPFSSLIGTQIQKSKMLTYKVSKTISFIFSLIMVNYEFLTSAGPFVFMCMPFVSVAAWIFAAFMLYLHINDFFFSYTQCSPLNNKIPAGRMCVIVQEEEEIVLQLYLPAEFTY